MLSISWWYQHNSYNCCRSEMVGNATWNTTSISKIRYSEKGRERACALRVTLPPQKGDRSSVKDVWHYASVPAQNPARRPCLGASRKIPTWRFLPHRPSMPNKTDGNGRGTRAIYCKYLGSMHFGRYGRRLNRRQVRTEWGMVGCQGTKLRIEARSGGSVAIGLAVVF